MAWDDPSPRNRTARPAPRDPGDLGDLAANMQPGYAGIGRQGYGDDNATLWQLVGRTLASAAAGALVYALVHWLVVLARGNGAASDGIAITAGLIVAALCMRNLSAGASRWGLADVFGWLVPDEGRGWGRRPVRQGWFARRHGRGDMYGDGYGPTFGEQVGAALAVDAVEAAIDALTD